MNTKHWRIQGLKNIEHKRIQSIQLCRVSETRKIKLAQYCRVEAKSRVRLLSSVKGNLWDFWKGRRLLQLARGNHLQEAFCLHNTIGLREAFCLQTTIGLREQCTLQEMLYRGWRGDESILIHCLNQNDSVFHWGPSIFCIIMLATIFAWLCRQPSRGIDLQESNCFARKNAEKELRWKQCNI